MSQSKKNIAIVAGGDSSEVVVSLKSAAGLYSFMDKDRYNLFIITIVGNVWQVEYSDTEKIEIDKNDFSFVREGNKTNFDFAYITIHGTPGENGILQGYFELIGLPYSCCGVLAAAITFNKFTCNQYLKGFEVKVSESLVLRKGQTVTNEDVASKIGFPCFIKPNVGGSSFGVTKVKSIDQV
ncbi:MAG: D-alanine--D-alanine ligase, partial [Paludibacter sp.]